MVAGFIRFFSHASMTVQPFVRSCFLPPHPSISVPRRSSSTSSNSSSMSLKNTVFQRERYSFKEPAEPCQLFDPVVR